MEKIGAKIKEIENRAAQNLLAKRLGIRLTGEVKARVADIKALEAKVGGESPEIIEQFNKEAEKERLLDDSAGQALQAKNN